MTGTSDLRRLFEDLLDVAPDGRVQALEALDVDDATRERLRAMLHVELELAEGATGEAPRQHPWPGDETGSYRLVAPLGDGGMGTVWLAASRAAPDVMVAVKFARGSRVDPAEARDRLIQERVVLAAPDHPNVVRIVDAGETAAGEPFLVLEARRGVALNVWATERRPSLEARVTVICRLASALDHVHSRGIVHRDVKPGNVVVTEDDWPVLLDFGVARVTADASISASYVTRGVAPHTPAFASPEQQAGEETTPASDVFALERLARDLFNGSFDDRELAVDRELKALCERACAADPRDRFSSAGELGTAIDRWARRGAGRRQRTISLWAFALSVLLAAAVGFVAARSTTSASGVTFEEFVASIEDLPASVLASDPAVLLDVAEATGEADLRVAAACLLTRTGDVDEAREQALLAADEVEDLSPLRAIELGALFAGFGLPAESLRCIEVADADDLESGLLFPARTVELRARHDGAAADEEGLLETLADIPRPSTCGSTSSKTRSGRNRPRRRPTSCSPCSPCTTDSPVPARPSRWTTEGSRRSSCKRNCARARRKSDAPRSSGRRSASCASARAW